jgi:Protein of unknown function (DUF1800)
MAGFSFGADASCSIQRWRTYHVHQLKEQEIPFRCVGRGSKERGIVNTPDALGALIALNRFGLGARPGDLAAAAGDPRGFLKEEAGRDDAALVMADLPSSENALQQMFTDHERTRQERELSAQALAASQMNGMIAAGAGMAEPPVSNPAITNGPVPDLKPKRAQPPLEQKLFRAEAMARFQKQSGAAAGYVERLVAFWVNHFAVSAAKNEFVRVAAGSFEREAIRPHVLGRYGDMLRAVETHPAMLAYLDNKDSVGPNSPAGKNPGKGLNENLARDSGIAYAWRRQRLYAGRCDVACSNFDSERRPVVRRAVINALSRKQIYERCPRCRMGADPHAKPGINGNNSAKVALITYVPIHKCYSRGPLVLSIR